LLAGKTLLKKYNNFVTKRIEARQLKDRGKKEAERGE
jgi:hypothetical protein